MPKFFNFIITWVLVFNVNCPEGIIEQPIEGEQIINFPTQNDLSLQGNGEDISLEQNNNEIFGIDTEAESRTIKKFQPEVLAVVKEKVTRGEDLIGKKINYFLKLYKKEGEVINELEKELSVIDDTLRSNSETGQKLNLKYVKSLTLKKISEGNSALRFLKSRLGDILTGYADLFQKLSKLETDIDNLKKKKLLNSFVTKRSKLENEDKDNFFSH